MPSRAPLPTPTPSPAAPWKAPRASRAGGPVLFGGSLLVLFLLLATVGLPLGTDRMSGVVAALSAAVGGLITPTLYLLGCFGLGRPIASVVARGSGSRLHLQLAVGIGTMLWVSHAMGVFGLLSEAGPLGPDGSRVAAWGAVGMGLLLLADQVVRGELRPERWPVFPIGLVLWTPALALLAIAASNPPLALWESEFGGYDALSYHLQLAKEWAAGPQGRVWPVHHNVYSYLPSYMEAGFTHLGAMSLGHGTAITRMLGEEGHWVYSCQFLHAGMGVVAALLVARLGRVLAERAGAPAPIAAFSGIAGAALMLGTPWTIVVGSLAYNELAMIAMAAGGMLVAADPTMGPVRRGVLAGWLVGIACSAKPTALLLVGPAVGVALIGWMGSGSSGRSAAGPREILRIVAAGLATGLLAIGPWLARNAIASGGNPVFPFAAGLLGRGDWTEEQVERYARSHATTLGIGERLWLLISRTGVLANGSSGGQARGLGHEQWSLTPGLALVALVILLVWKPTRRTGTVLAVGMLLTLIAWGAFTHIQSRFLLPLVVPMGAAFGVAACAVLMFAMRRISGEDRERGRTLERGAEQVRPLPVLAAAVLGALPLTIAGWSAINFMRQYQAQPNRLLVLGAGGLSGMLFENSLAAATPELRAKFLDEVQPAAYVNLSMRGKSSSDRDQDPDEPRGVYLLGDAAPLYYLDALGEPRADAGAAGRPSVSYHTTWDASPLGEAMAAAPDEPRAWTGWMRAHGFGYVLVNYGELMRLIEKDHNYDPRVTSERIQQWLAPQQATTTGVVSVRRWTIPADASGRKQFVSSELFRIGKVGGDRDGKGDEPRAGEPR